jgi:thioredoxin 1
MIQVTGDKLAEVLLQHDVVVIDFFAPWCGPCKQMAPVVKRISDEHARRALVAKCDIDQESAAAVKYSIKSIPTVILFQKGKEVERIVGFIPNFEEELKQKIVGLLAL